MITEGVAERSNDSGSIAKRPSLCPYSQVGLCKPGKVNPPKCRSANPLSLL